MKCWSFRLLARTQSNAQNVTNFEENGPFSQQAFWFATVWQWASVHNISTLKLKQLNGIQPSLILLSTPVLFSTVAHQTPVKTGLLETADGARKRLGLFPGCRLRCESFSNSTKTGAMHILTPFWQKSLKSCTCGGAATVREISRFS